MLHMELSAEVVEGEEGVGEHQVLGVHVSGDEWGERSCPAHPDNGGPRTLPPIVPSVAYLPGGLGVQDLSQQLLPISAEHVGGPAQESHIPAHQL